MSYAHVASTVKGLTQNGGTTDAVNTTGANLLVAVGSWYPASGGAPNLTITDSYGNTWTGLTARELGNTKVRLWYSAAPIVGSGHTLSTSTGDSYSTLWFGAFSGAAASPFDQESGATTGGATSLAPGSVTPSEAGCLCVTGVTSDGSTLTVPTGYTGGVANYSVGVHMGGGGAYLIQGAAAATNPAWAAAASAGMAAALATFKAAAGGGGGSAAGADAMHHYLRNVAAGKF